MPAAFFVVASATTCIASAGVAIAPSPSVPADSVAHTGLGIAAAVAAKFGLEASSPRSPEDTDWLQCFAKETLWLCGKLQGGELQFQFTQAMTTRLTPWGDSVRVALLDSLRSRFGQYSARECEWKYQRKTTEYTCVSQAVSLER